MQECYSDELIASLPEELGLDDLGEAARFKLIIRRWAGLNLTVLQDEMRTPTVKQTQQELRDARAEAESLNIRLQNLGDDAVGSLWQAAAHFDAPQESEPKTDRWALGSHRADRAGNEVALLSLYLQMAIDNLEPLKTGPQAKKRRIQVRRDAVAELGCIWREFSGQNPHRRLYKQDHPEKPGQPYGPFYDYVVTLLLPIFGVEASTGIDQDIKIVCAGMEKSPEQYTTSLIQTT